jgi:hypothetical protein
MRGEIDAPMAKKISTRFTNDARPIDARGFRAIGQRTPTKTHGVLSARRSLDGFDQAVSDYRLLLSVFQLLNLCFQLVDPRFEAFDERL